jgi:hypothetical protein
MQQVSPEKDGMGPAESQPAAMTPKLRWYQYSLRSLSLLMLAVSVT